MLWPEEGEPGYLSEFKKEKYWEKEEYVSGFDKNHYEYKALPDIGAQKLLEWLNEFDYPPCLEATLGITDLEDQDRTLCLLSYRIDGENYVEIEDAFAENILLNPFKPYMCELLNAFMY